MPTTLIRKAEDIAINQRDEVDQILGRPPGWLLKWGISLVFLAMSIFLLLTWWIKFPDTVSVNVTILTENPAIRLVSTAEGRIESLLVEDQQYVQKGTKLAVIESPVDESAISDLEDWLDKLKVASSYRDYRKIDLPSSSETFGTLEPQYATLVQKVQDYQHHLKYKRSSVSSKIKVLKDQIASHQKINRSIRKQQATLKKELAIAKRNHQRNQQLNQEGVISDIALEEIEKVYLQYQRQLDNFETQTVSNDIQVEQLESQIIDLKQNRAEEKNGKELSIREDIQSLEAAIVLWKKAYQIRAPIAGKVSLSAIWSPNQYVRAGEEMMTIVPTRGAGNIIAKAKLPTENSGKVKVGQLVNIKLDGFPYQEFGIIKASVAQISLVPEGSAYYLDLALPHSLITTYDRKIDFQQEMEGTADIITEDRRILQRIFDRIWNLIKNA
ncbi:MAG: HlyD family efflux transporter periplasmic adaptor subunit [Bacteroidota bacterium]